MRTDVAIAIHKRCADTHDLSGAGAKTDLAFLTEGSDCSDCGFTVPAGRGKKQQRCGRDINGILERQSRAGSRASSSMHDSLRFLWRCSASSIFSVGDNYLSRCLTSIVTGGNNREQVEAVLLRGSRGGGKAGNLPLVFHFSSRFVVGLLGMWESRSDSQGLWKAGCAFHHSVISRGSRYSASDSAFAFLACSTR